MRFVRFLNAGYYRVAFMFVEGSGVGRGPSEFVAFGANVVSACSHSKSPKPDTASMVPAQCLGSCYGF